MTDSDDARFVRAGRRIKLSAYEEPSQYFDVVVLKYKFQNIQPRIFTDAKRKSVTGHEINKIYAVAIVIEFCCSAPSGQ